MRNLRILSVVFVTWTSTHAATLALVGGKVYTAPDAQPIADGVVVARDGKIEAVGRRGSVAIPKDAELIDFVGRVVTAGFQNSHVHFTEPKWNGAAKKPAAELTRQLAEMLTQYGFTTVVDTGSEYANSAALRARIQSGEIAGPRMLLSGASIFPAGGIPFYLRETLPPAELKFFPQPATADEARSIVRQGFGHQAEILKLFTGSLVERNKVQPMDPAVTRAAVEEAHQRGKLVFSHPSNLEGVQIALDAGVDVLAHSTSADGRWSPELIAAMKAHRMSLIPTLQLWQFEAKRSGRTPEQALIWARDRGRNVRLFRDAGGQILFGTDVGYMTEYDPALEYSLLTQSGLTVSDILAALTTAPAQRFKEDNVRGRIAAGFAADLVVLAADPADDPKNFARVQYAIRDGSIIYRREQEAKPAANASGQGRIVGIGGVFFKSANRQQMRDWYGEHLGLADKGGGVMLPWREKDNPDKEHVTVWTVFPATTKYFEANQSFMLNYIVDDLDALLERLQKEGVKIDPKRQDADYGRFAWIYDPDGNKVELWQPLPAKKK